MIPLLRKEINTFFGSVIGYIVIVVFLASSGLFLWIFPGDMNILESGYSSLNPFFYLAPWVFLFLVPAITMRLFSDEKKSGTLELLITKPLTEVEIIVAKFLSGLTLVVISVLPSLIFVYSVSELGNPPGNLDWGATWGSFLGLIFIGAAYVSIGLFASSVTENQVISFIVGLILCFFAFVGFDYIASIELFSPLESFVINLGINEHYLSISRGVLDSRDLLYFISLAVFFLMLTRLAIRSRKW